jgi:hypothetical protein
MNSKKSTDLDLQLEKITAEVRAIADRYQGDTLELLHLLRTLEFLHREIQEGYFQASLPSSRHSLYTLLRDIEESGGWPYIERGKLQSFLKNLTDLHAEGDQS